MKPNKNRVFCRGCGRHKILFESSSKAEKFIHFNAEEIRDENGKAPVRCYYCEMCGGYHVTSNPSEEIGQRLSQRDQKILEKISTIKIQNKEYDEMCSSIKKDLEDVRILLCCCEIDKAEEFLHTLKIKFKEFYQIQDVQNCEKKYKLRVRLDKICNLLATVKEILLLPEIEQSNAHENINLATDQKLIKNIVSNYKVINKIETILTENNKKILDNYFSDISANLLYCRNLLLEIKGECSKIIVKKYSKIILKQESHLETSISSSTKTAQHVVKPKIYKKTILSLIKLIESIENNYSTCNYEACETSLEIGYYMLYELNFEDENTELIKNHLDIWQNRIKEYM
jgi:hypothetical protein